jgi:hypothetical protein
VPYLSRDPSASGQKPAHTYPIARSYALILAAALLALIVLRHLFGSVTIGVR